MGTGRGAGPPTASPPPPGHTVRQRTLLVAGLVTGAWAMLPPFVGPGLDTALGTEIADHPVPGLVVLAVTVVATRWSGGASDAWFLAGLVVTLAGVWQVASHVPLVAQAARGGAPWLATVHHVLPGVVVLGLGVAWVVSHR